MRILALAALLTLAACRPDAEAANESAAADTLTRAQKDSIVSTLPIPGAAGVGRAIDAAGAMEDRAAAMDSIR